MPLFFILRLITWLITVLLFARAIHQLQVYASLWADLVGRFTKPGLNTLRSVGGAAKAGFCLLPFAATICAPGSISFSGREKIWLNQTDESLVTVAGLIRRTTDLSTADTNAADYLAFSIDEVAIFRVEVGYSTLPQPAAIIESLKAVEADGAKVIKDLRDFMPRVRNYGMMVQWTIN